MTSGTISKQELATVIEAYNDVTERLKQSHELLGREVCRLREELQEKNRELARRERLAALGEMAAGVAHEIRNPLGAIGLYASLLDRDLEDLPEQQEIVRRIGVGVKNLESIVGDILAFAGESDPHRRSTRLGAVLESVMTQTAPQAQASGVTIHLDASLSEVQLFCDPSHIERALMNLILNAIDACGDGGSIWIKPGADRQDESRFPIVVEDDGRGIAPEVLHRIFNPFFTTKDTGTGLGLAIVHRIAEAHGGHVRAGQRAGGGASMGLTLPLATACHTTETGGNE